MYDENGDSRGYGFVRFSDETEQKRALVEMQGVSGLGNRPIKVSHATPKNKPTTTTTSTEQALSQTYANQQQWWQQYQDYSQYYQQYYNYYNYQQPNYYNQQTAAYGTAQQGQQYGTGTANQQQSTTAATTYQAKKVTEKLEDPDVPLDIAAENALYMEEHTGLIDNVVDCHWQPLDTITSKIPEVATT